MKHDRRGDWLNDVESGHLLTVIHEAPLYPQSMWSKLSDDDTWVMMMPVLQPDDHVVVLDVLSDERDPDDMRTFAALVVSPVGVGCILLLSEHFRML